MRLQLPLAVLISGLSASLSVGAWAQSPNCPPEERWLSYASATPQMVCQFDPVVRPSVQTQSVGVSASLPTFDLPASAASVDTVLVGRFGAAVTAINGNATVLQGRVGPVSRADASTLDLTGNVARGTRGSLNPSGGRLSTQSLLRVGRIGTRGSAAL